jgi:hypothetical protein
VSEPNLHLRLISIERQLLQEMCGSEGPAVSQRVAAELQHYPWQNHDHQIVFEALARIKAIPVPGLRPALASETTRMGFPDIDLSEYFPPATRRQTSASATESEQRVIAIVQQLKTAAAHE